MCGDNIRWCSNLCPHTRRTLQYSNFHFSFLLMPRSLAARARLYVWLPIYFYMTLGCVVPLNAHWTIFGVFFSIVTAVEMRIRINWTIFLHITIFTEKWKQNAHSHVSVQMDNTVNFYVVLLALRRNWYFQFWIKSGQNKGARPLKIMKIPNKQYQRPSLICATECEVGSFACIGIHWDGVRSSRSYKNCLDEPESGINYQDTFLRISIIKTTT